MGDTAPAADPVHGGQHEPLVEEIDEPEQGHPEIMAPAISNTRSCGGGDHPRQQRGNPVASRRECGLSYAVALALVLVAPTIAALVSGGDSIRPGWSWPCAPGRWWSRWPCWPRAPPASRGGRAAVAGLVLLACWVLASMAWAPLPGPAWHDAQRVALYAGGLLAAHGLLSRRQGRLAVEPALVGGALVIALYALSERLLPGLVELERSVAALGRLNQPLTYWNAEGSVMAVALVLALRLGGTPERPRALRLGALTGAPWLGLACTGACRGAPSRRWPSACSQCCCWTTAAPRSGPRSWASPPVFRSSPRRSCSRASRAPTAAPATGCGAGGGARRVRPGRLAGARWVGGAMAGGRQARLSLSPAMGAVLVAGIVALGAAVTVAGGSDPPESPGPRADAGRLQSLGSNRGEYWSVALGVAADHPLVGHGSGSFEVDWSRERTITEGVRDAHSLVLDMPPPSWGSWAWPCSPCFWAGWPSACRPRCAATRRWRWGPPRG